MSIWNQQCRNRQRLSVLVVLFAGTMFLAPATAVEPLSTERLMRYCEKFEGAADSPDARACIRYIQGFVDGAIATDGWVAENVARELDAKQDYSDRLAEIRFGRETREYGPTYFAEFCIPDEETLTEVAVKVVFDLRTAGFVDDTPLARDAVFKALRKDYRCES